MSPLTSVPSCGDLHSGPHLIHGSLHPHESGPNGLVINSAILHSSLVCPANTHHDVMHDICSNRPHLCNACDAASKARSANQPTTLLSIFKTSAQSNLAKGGIIALSPSWQQNDSFDADHHFIHAFWIYMSQIPKQTHKQFGHFCTAHPCRKHTYRQTQEPYYGQHL